jgi:hypothetical protein
MASVVQHFINRLTYYRGLEYRSLPWHCRSRCLLMPRVSPDAIRLSSAELAQLEKRAGEYTLPWTYIAGLDVHHARIFGRCEEQNGIEPFDRLVEQVMTRPPYKDAPKASGGKRRRPHPKRGSYCGPSARPMRTWILRSDATVLICSLKTSHRRRAVALTPESTSWSSSLSLAGFG